MPVVAVGMDGWAVFLGCMAAVEVVRRRGRNGVNVSVAINDDPSHHCARDWVWREVGCWDEVTEGGASQQQERGGRQGSSHNGNWGAPGAVMLKQRVAQDVRDMAGGGRRRRAGACRWSVEMGCGGLLTFTDILGGTIFASQIGHAGDPLPDPTY
ncbi:uncharacterized protein MYCFIDRAFT_205745 [Pseudocercospora fijiensis CIRAD86]|uniref:Uncharacterized protein n=1 Tax=Pseudocercospora fijiensis (strain CIRAD86) TaxID=383855 RepID=N1Q9U0_PSEFD|nr:uncharacterized protein MYCFIDRAFT_205745 [Pseudocercospora fijiensis CIRAD86]EME87643.1 hypothetical protein MYCFIDRAFT_205745 [Pseudocercospora fijiensis CIRAD86]